MSRSVARASSMHLNVSRSCARASFVKTFYHVHSLLHYVSATSLRLVFILRCSSAMAFVGPVWNVGGYRPVGVYCEICDTNLLTWRCYGCGGLYCGRCIFRHDAVPGASLAYYDAGIDDPNEVAEGMHCLWRRAYLRQASLIASDPAAAAFSWSNRGWRCR